MFDKVLIANRGEIALRILRACREMGIQAVAVHSTADNDAMHVRLADEAVCIGPPPAKDSYLNVSAILSAATIANVDAIHPGYGFLSEHPEFARRCEDEGLIFIGPTADCLALVGDKARARQAAIDAGVTVVPGSPGPVESAAEARRFADELGYPIMLKAAAGGGGKGIRLVDADDARPPIVEGRARIRVKNPRAVANLTLQFHGLAFPQAGEYRVQLYCGGELLREARLEVMHVKPRKRKPEDGPKDPGQPA